MHAIYVVDIFLSSMQTPKKMLILKQKLLLTSGWSGRVHLYRSVIILSLGRVGNW